MVTGIYPSFFYAVQFFSICKKTIGVKTIQLYKLNSQDISSPIRIK